MKASKCKTLKINLLISQVIKQIIIEPEKKRYMDMFNESLSSEDQSRREEIDKRQAWQVHQGCGDTDEGN